MLLLCRPLCCVRQASEWRSSGVHISATDQSMTGVLNLCDWYPRYCNQNEKRWWQLFSVPYSSEGEESRTWWNDRTNTNLSLLLIGYTYRSVLPLYCYKIPPDAYYPLLFNFYCYLHSLAKSPLSHGNELFSMFSDYLLLKMHIVIDA